MLKKSAIFGLVLLLTGTVVLGWVIVERRKQQQKAASYRLKYRSEPDEYLRQYNEWAQLSPQERTQLPLELNRYAQSKTKTQLRQEQQERLSADLDKLAAGEMDAHPFADVLYGKNWQNEVSKYKKRKELNEFIYTGSIVCTSVGGAAFASCLLLWTARILIGVFAYMRRFLAGVLYSRRQTQDREPLEADIEDLKQQQNPREQPGGVSILRRVAKWGTGQHKKRSQPLRDSGGQNLTVSSSKANQSSLDKPTTSGAKGHMGTFSANNDKKIAVLLTDADSVQPTRETATQDKNVNPTRRSQSTPKARQDSLADSQTPKALGGQESVQFDDSVKVQTENLEKQMAEFKKMAQNVQKTTIEHSKPLNSALKELTQQVSAIREYASYQQERVEKLQDGYDWNIVRTFCLRVIRCIDNLESRIDRLSKSDMETEHLSEVRDELIFALESSGIEQFEPELNSDYRGQEKCSEAVKEKEHCKNPKQAGKIAKVIRPGYQYFINDGNVKIVRTAQVKLFG